MIFRLTIICVVFPHESQKEIKRSLNCNDLMESFPTAETKLLDWGYFLVTYHHEREREREREREKQNPIHSINSNTVDKKRTHIFFPVVRCWREEGR